MLNKELIEKLKEQHKKIDNILNQINIELNHQEWDRVDIFNLIQRFKSIFFEHLTLEDDEFYPRLLRSLLKEGEDIREVHDFMNKMDFIVSKINSFFDFYDTLDKVKNTDKFSFQSEFVNVMSNLEIRMNVEELFVYNRFLKSDHDQ